MKCHACGRELNKDVKHWMYCGTPVPSGKEQASLKPVVNLKEQGLLQPDSRRPFPRWIPAALSGVLLLCLTLYWIIPKANSSTGSNTYPEPSAEAAAEEPAAAGSVTASDEEIYIPDPVLKKAIQDELGIGDREILASDAERLERLQHVSDDELLWRRQHSVKADKEKISDLTGISAFQNLKTVDLNDNQISDLSPLAGMTQLTELGLGYNQITDLTPLAGLNQLTYLHLDNNEITDLTPLAGLNQLTDLNLYSNKITDITPLAGMTKMTNLDLNCNKISDITPLAGMTQMTELDLMENKITDITPLAGMTKLTYLNLIANYITDYSPLDSLPDDCEIWLTVGESPDRP